MKLSKVMFNIATVFCFIYFALYIFSLVFIPIGVYCFLAGKAFAYKAEHPDNNIYVSDKVLKRYVIFASIFVFPFGLLSVIALVKLTSNNIKVTSAEGEYTVGEQTLRVESSDVAQTESETQESEPAEAEVHTEQSEEEKLETIKKLENFREKGLITDEELEQARDQLFGKKDN